MPRLPDSFFQELLSVTDIEGVIAPYLRLKRGGGNSLTGLCPFHSEKTPSFTVSVDKGLFYCFGCGAGGNAVTFLQKIENLEFMEAVKELADRAGLHMPEMNAAQREMERLRAQILEANREAARFYHERLISGGEPLEYLLRRGITRKTIRHFGLGFAPNGQEFMTHMRSKGYGESVLIAANLARKNSRGERSWINSAFWNRIIFPIIDVRGRVIAFGGRVMDDSMPKYINTSDTPVYKKSAGVYALNFAKNAKERRLILAEGYMDVIALHQAGFNGAVACLGTATTKEQALLLRRYTDEVVLSYDADEAGQRAATRAISIFDGVGLKVRVLHWDKARDGKDPDEIIARHGSERFQRLLDGAANDVEFQLRAEKARFDLSTDDGKRNYLARVCEIMASMRLSETTQDIYAGRLAEELNVGKDAILKETRRRGEILQRRSKKREREFIPANLAPVYAKEGTIPVEQRLAEETILSSLIRSPELYPKLRGEIRAQLFHSSLAKLLLERLEVGEDPNSLAQELNYEDMATLTRLQMERGGKTDSVRECRDCIAVLAKARDRPPDDVTALSDDAFRKLFTG
ncbi:MAG: DNA primase [Oscillospiraceae bacterium]|nr:DNA primase [Oscillospiraceae bacterium]